MTKAEELWEDESLPVNTKALLNRIREILEEGETNSLMSLSEEDGLKILKIVYMITYQLIYTEMDVNLHYILQKIWNAIKKLS